MVGGCENVVRGGGLTLATVRRETGGWRAPLLMAGYLFGLAWLAAFLTYRIASGVSG